MHLMLYVGGILCSHNYNVMAGVRCVRTLFRKRAASKPIRYYDYATIHHL